MALGDIYRCALKYQLDGVLNVNVMHFEQTRGTQDSSAAAAAELCPLMAFTWNYIIGGRNWNHQYTLEVNKVSRIQLDFGSFTQVETTNSLNQDRLPLVVQNTVSLYTGLSGRTRRGRIFISGVSAEGVTAGALNAVGVDNADNFLEQFTLNFIGNSSVAKYNIGIFSRERYKILSNPFDSYFARVTNAVIRPNVGTMHSRKNGIGA